MDNREQISEIGLRSIGKNKSSPRQNHYHLRRLLFEQMEDRRLLAVIDLATLSAAQGTTIFGADVGDISGTQVSSAGDVNGDGFDDMLIGASKADASTNSKDLAGDTYLVFGGPSLPATFDLANLGSAGITIFGADAGDRSGWSVSSAGDVNGDDFNDLLFGAIRGDASGNSKTDAGESYVIFGSASLPTTIDLASLGSAGITIFGADALDHSGWSVSSAGDVNGDGFDDLIIGAYSADAAGNNKPNAGESYVIFGDATMPKTIDLASLGSAGITISGADAGDLSGKSVSSAGDVNGDGFDDIFIGAPFAGASGNNKPFAGESYVIFGGASLPATIDLMSLGSAGITIFGAEISDFSGSVGSAGDMNGDGFDDLIIGAGGADALGNSKPYAGESYVIFGNASLPTTIDLANPSSAGITIFGADADDDSGHLSSSGDVNGDGFDDLIIGAYAADAAGNSKPNAGDSYVIFGNASPPTTIDLASLGSVGITIYGADAGDKSLPSTGRTGDVNGDGFDDLLIGALRAGALGNLKSEAGDSYLIFGGNDFTSSVTHLGTTNGETLMGTAAANVMNGGRGNDTLIGSGGADVLTGGQGNDILAASDLTFKRIVGGTGSDTLRLDGSGLSLNLTTLADNRLLGIESIDITGSGNNTLMLNQREVLNLSDESNTLTVRRNAGDVVNIGSGWTQVANETIGPDSFNVYQQGAATLKVAVPVFVLPPKVFYNNSGYETSGTVADALDNSKTVLRSSDAAQTTSFANVSGYTLGINGVVLDVMGVTGGAITAADFTFRVAPPGTTGTVNPSTWPAAPAPTAVVVTNGTTTVPARIQLEWADNAIQNTWLQIIVKVNANTGLASPAVFYLGSALGDTNGAVGAGSAYRTGVPDLSAIQGAITSSVVLVDNVLDVDKNRRVGVTDLSYVQSHVASIVLLNNIIIPVAGSTEEGSAVGGGGGSRGSLTSSGIGAPPVQPFEQTSMTMSSTQRSIRDGENIVDRVQIVDDFFADLDLQFKRKKKK